MRDSVLLKRFATFIADPIDKAIFALIVGVAPAGNAGVQKPWMALDFHILVTWIRLRGLTAPAIHAGMTVLIYFQLLTRT
ncbi:MAG: hypothetical protein KGZ88_21815 [Methylomicrobium sp.]|nr:hypothetical protein [Methylomicrobium sp.]